MFLFINYEDLRKSTIPSTDVSIQANCCKQILYESMQSTCICMIKYHKIIIGAIASIATLGLAVPFAAAVYCDSVQDFDGSCLRLENRTLSDLLWLAGAEIYYDHLIYYMNPYLREDPGSKDRVFSLSGDIPKEFTNQVRLVYNEQSHSFEQKPRPVLIHLQYNSTVTVFSESKLNYAIIDGLVNRHVIGTIDAEDSWSRDFDGVGSYGYWLEPQSEHDARSVFLEILVIDEPIKDIPKSIRHSMACRLLSINSTEYPFYAGTSCGGSGDPIRIGFDRTMLGANLQYKEEILDRIAQDAGFLEPDVTFEYKESSIPWHILIQLMLSSPAVQ